MTALWTVLIAAGVILLALGLAWVPMQFLLAQMAKNVRELIQRQRERRAAARGTPDRRRA
jgi:hypothetical protein